jgi:hypothetical protein
MKYTAYPIARLASYSRISPKRKVTTSYVKITLSIRFHPLTGNQTVVFDCCFSGSGTRQGERFDSIRLSRFAEVANNVPRDLDRDIWQGLHNDRATKIASGFLQSGLRSHVLLAACGADETAKEDRTLMRGDFTKAFLETIRTVGAEKITYTDLMQRIPQLPE